MTVSLTHPHDPYTIEKKYWDMYEDVDITLPEVTIPQDEQDAHSEFGIKVEVRQRLQHAQHVDTHFMRVIDHWREAGFAAIANEYASRLECQDGLHQAINNSGDLLVRRSGKAVELRPLWPELAAPSWLDPNSGGPRR